MAATAATTKVATAATPGHHGGHDGFMVHPDDQGRWMQVVLYAKRSSEPGVADGVARIWRRWEGEPTHTLLSESAGRGFSAPPTGPDGPYWAGRRTRRTALRAAVGETRRAVRRVPPTGPTARPVRPE